MVLLITILRSLGDLLPEVVLKVIEAQRVSEPPLGGQSFQEHVVEVSGWGKEVNCSS